MYQSSNCAFNFDFDFDFFWFEKSKRKPSQRLPPLARHSRSFRPLIDSIPTIKRGLDHRLGPTILFLKAIGLKSKDFMSRLKSEASVVWWEHHLASLELHSWWYDIIIMWFVLGSFKLPTIYSKFIQNVALPLHCKDVMSDKMWE